MRSLLILLALAAASSAEEITPVAAILKDKKSYDRRFSCVAGKSSVLFTKVSRNKHAYFTVWIADGDAKLKVFGYGKPQFLEGERIEACGVFSVEHQHSGRVFYDEMSAKVILREGEIGKGRVALTQTDARLITTHP
ncbi:MAG: hypothetical protein HY077_11940 [Elusimicrobia bacterium]|nr:hypothetical protein [Elusimicrobiota bacterium]